MNDYIKREDATEAVWRILNGMGISQKHNDRLVEEVDAVLDEYTAADVRPVVRGKWEDGTGFIFSGLSQQVRCSKCGSIAYFYDKMSMNFCPNCGTDMRPTLMSGANGEES